MPIVCVVLYSLNKRLAGETYATFQAARGDALIRQGATEVVSRSPRIGFILASGSSCTQPVNRTRQDLGW